MTDDMQTEDSVELLSFFDLMPENFAWRTPVPQQIEDRRVQMSDLLIFDILLSSGGVRHPSSLYPPIDVSALQRLLDAIENSTYDTLKQDCLVYFLLKWHRDGREDTFKAQRCIPPQFVALADTYWHLDSGVNVPRAVSLLSDARLNKEYTSKILQALLLTENPNPLIRKYARTAKPLLTEPDDIDAFTVALADCSLLEAWQYQRSFSETSETRERLIRKILDWCLAPKPRPLPLKQLLAYPLSQYEQRLLHTYAVSPPAHIPSASIPAIQDLVCLRLVQAGEFAAAVKLERQLSARSALHTSEKYQRAAQERRQMMDDIMAAMPVAERQLLEVELEQFAEGKGVGMPSLSASWSSKMGNGGDLSMSWESVRGPSAAGPSSVSATMPVSGARAAAAFMESPVPAIPQRAGAPRFGGPSPVSAGHGDMYPPLVSAFSPSRAPATAPPYLGTGISPSRVVRRSPAFIIPRSAESNTRPTSLFDTAGSANNAPNAFYQPPATAGVKRPFGQDSPRAAPAPSNPSPMREPAHPPAPQVEEVPDDIDMHEVDEQTQNENESQRAEAPPPEHIRMEEEDTGVSAEFSVSVFSPPRSSSTKKKLRVARTDSEPVFVPGAFIDESDEEEAVPPTPSRRPRREQRPMVPFPRTPSPPPVRMTRARSARKPARDRDLGRSLPGTLMDEEEEEEDVVAPLPPPTPATRRATRRAKNPRDDMTEAELVRPRRSTRLSVESSPEPSPQKPSTKSRGTRKSTTGATTKSTSRKKR